MYDREDVLKIKKLEILLEKTHHPDNVGNYYEIIDEEGLRDRGINIAAPNNSIMKSEYYRSYKFKEGIFSLTFFKLLLMMTLSSAYLITMTFLFKPMIERGTEIQNHNSSSETFNHRSGDNFLIMIATIANFL